MNGLELTQRAVDLFRSIYGNKSTKGLCQKFDGYYWQWAWQGNENGIQIYGSAKLAADASAMFTTDINSPDIEPGDLLYWHYVDSKGNNYGHVCTAVGRDGARVLVSNTATTGDAYKALTNDVKISHADTINLKFRGASHTNGKNARRTGVTAWPQVALGPQQRQVRPGVEARRRLGSPSTAAAQGEPIPAGTIGNFRGWVAGENVSGNDLWYVGTSGDFFHSSAFTEVSKHDLADMNQQKVATRVVLSNNAANVRATPYTSDKIVAVIGAGEEVEVAGWTTGERVSNQGIWYRVAQGWAWSGGFTSQSTYGIASLPAPPPPGDGLDDAYKTLPPDSALVKWVGSPNYNYREPRPAGAEPTHVTMHWMDGTLAGTDAQFQKYGKVVNGRGDGSASTYGVGQTEIHQYVQEKSYQQADGDTNSNRWGLSIEHEGSTTKPVSQAVMDLSASLLVDIARRHGWTEYIPYDGDAEAFRVLPDADQLAHVTAFAAQNPTRRLVFPHKAWASTSCPGTLDWRAIVKAANAQLAPTPPAGGIEITREFVEAKVALLEQEITLWKGLLS